jgi:hypothetical protein
MAELTEQEKKDGFQLTKWNGYDNYECLRCAYKTLWAGKMADHIQTGNHVWGREDGPLIVDEPKASTVVDRVSEY